MIRISDEDKAQYKADNVHKELEIRIPSANITIHNEDILSESMSLRESIESDNNLSFMGCNAAVFQVETVDIVQDIEGMWIEVDITADNTDPLPLFRGYIDEVTNTTHEEYTTKILAYDALYRINNADVTTWYNNLTFPISILNMRNSFFAHFGIEQEADYLPNDGVSVLKTIEDKVINGADIIKPICQLNGRFGRISRTGIFQYVHLVEGTEALYPREDLYPADDLYPSAENALDNVNKAHYISTSFENYRVSPITKVQLVDKEGQIAATAGDGTNAFTVNDNPLIWGKSGAELTNIAANLYNTIQGLWYTPADITCIGLPYVECGDFVLLAAKRSIIRAYVLTRELRGIQSLKDTYTAQGSKKQPPYIPTIEQKVVANTQAIHTERERATTSESNLNTGINNEVNRAKASENSIKDDVTRFKNVTADNFSATNAKISNLSASVANIGNLVATKASISDLQATNARVDNLEATKITASQIDARVINALHSGATYLSCTSIYVNGTRFTHGADIPIFNSAGKYVGSRTFLIS